MGNAILNKGHFIGFLALLSIGQCALLFLTPLVWAQGEVCADFDDLVAGTEYYVGDTLFTQGYKVGFKEFFWLPSGSTIDGVATVDTAGMAGGSGFDLIVNNINVEVDIAGDKTPECVSFRFGDYDGNVNLEVNGDLKNVENFTDLEGMDVGGATVHVIMLGGSKGVVELQGSVTQLAIGGQQFYLDDICPFCKPPAAICADFDDLVGGTKYYVGDTFVTQGYQAKCKEFFYLPSGSTVDGVATVTVGGDAGGSGFDLNLGNINVDIDIAGDAPPECVSFRYGEYGGNINLEVNGDFKNFENFPDIDGTVVGGVAVKVIPLGGYKGVVELHGTVNQLALGGQEFYIDDVCPFCKHPEGVCADFDDLAAGTEYKVGDAFFTQGYLFTCNEFFWSGAGSTVDGTATVMTAGMAGGSGFDLNLNNINVDIAIDAPCVSFRYGEYGGNLNLEVNGDFRNFEDFSVIDGTLIGGVPVDVISLGGGLGMVQFLGPVNQLMLGGQEFFIDDICPFCESGEGEGEVEGEGEPPDVCADFDDLTAGTMYSVGDSFVTQGYTLQCMEFFWLSGSSTVDGYAKVENSGMAGGSGYDLWLNNINVDIAIAGAVPAPCVSFRYGEYGGNLNLEVNGDFRNFANFADIHGTVIGGTTVNVIPLGGSLGMVELRGPVNQLKLGGQEFVIDDVCPFCKPDEGEGEGEPLTYHPSDPNGDSRIVMSEAIAYLAGWQQGSNPMGYAIRAAYIWQAGEYYYYDDTLEPPMCWIPIPIRP